MQNGSPVQFRKGSCKITIYAPTKALPYYRLCYRIGGKRYQRTRKTYEEAEKAARMILDKLAAGETSLAEISQLDVAILRTTSSELAEFDMRLDRAVLEYTSARKQLGDVPLRQAIDFFLQRHPLNLHPIGVAELVNEFLAAKHDSGVSSSYISDLEFRLRSLVREFDGSVDQLTEQGVAGYFRKLDFAPENHCNQMRVVRTLFNYTRQQGYLSESVDLLRSVSKKRVIRREYTVYQPQEYHALLEAAATDMLPALALLGFCGVRPAEMRKLSWEDIRFDTRTLIVDASNAKTASRRTVPLCEGAARFLVPYRGSEGLIWGKTTDHWNKRFSRLHEQSGVQKQANGLRHSYISYRLTLTGDVNRTALEAGNSPAIIHRHYHALVDDPRLAEEWFGENVTNNCPHTEAAKSQL